MEFKKIAIPLVFVIGLILGASALSYWNSLAPQVISPGSECPEDMNYQVAYATTYSQPFAPLQDANYITALMQSGYTCNQDQQTGIVLCAESVRTEVGWMCIKEANQ